MKILEREALCLDLLRKLPQRFVLIGGYAASSFDFPRFSVDLDLIIKGKDARGFAETLQRGGFELVREAGEFAKFYEGRIMRFERKVDSLPLGVDLFVNMVQSRQTDAAYSFDYLWENSEIRRVVGSGVKDHVEVRVADREMLMALKINSMRMADQRDIIALSNGPVDAAKVIDHLRRAPRDRILSHLDIISATLEKPESKDSIKGVFGISDRVYERCISKARREIGFVRQAISSLTQYTPPEKK